MKTIKSSRVAESARPSVFKRLGMGAFTVSLVVHGIFVLVAVLFFYKWIYPPPEEKVTPTGDGATAGESTSQIKSRKYQAAATVNFRKIAVPEISDVVMPETSNAMSDVALPNNLAMQGGAGPLGRNGAGPGTPNANNPGPGFGPRPGLAFMTPFGGNLATEGSMPGRFYDFKQDRAGKPTSGYVVSNRNEYTDRVNKIQGSGFSESAFRKYFQAPDSLYLTQLAIPTSDANLAPKFFQVADKVKPSGWMVVYDGRVSTNRDITFRFVGVGDDYISVFNNRRPKLINAWPDMRQYVMGRWEPSEPLDEAAPTPMPGCPLMKGDWITLRRGEKIDLSISVGERPGGKVGFVLMVEEKGAAYRTVNGQQVLPLFTTQPISDSSRERITNDFPKWQFEWENVPVFGVDKTSRMTGDF